MYRVQKDKNNPYVMLNKTFLNDETISWKAKGILAYLLSLPDDWKIYESEIVKHSSDGISATKAGIKELIDNGYIERKRLRESGRFSGYEYTVFEVPHHMRFSDNGYSNNGKPNTTNNDFSNNDLNNILQKTSLSDINWLIEECSDDLNELLKNYCYLRFNKKMRTNKNNVVFDNLEDAFKGCETDVIEWLDKRIISYDQMNFDYLLSIEGSINRD
jgi:hypothetical protein